MSATEANIEQRIIDAGIECHALTQALHDQLKTHYLLEICRLHHQPDLGKPVDAGFLDPLSGSQSRSRLHINTALIASFGGLHVADGIVTYLGLRFAQVAEVNPLLNYVAELLGLGVSITLLKLVILGLITAIFFERHKIRNRWSTTSLALAVMFYICVIVSNVLLVAGL